MTEASGYNKKGVILRKFPYFFRTYTMSNSGKLGELLLREGLITQDQLKAALEHQTKSKLRLGNSLVELGHINEKVLATFLSRQFGMQAISLDGVSIPGDLVKLVPRSLCDKHNLVPLALESNRLVVAISDPTNMAAVDDIRFLCNMDTTLYLATQSGIKALVDKTYGPASAAPSEESPKESSKKQEAAKKGGEPAAKKDPKDIDGETAGADKSVIPLINKLFVEAIKQKTSDIHIEPFENHSRVRFRIDGSLHEVMRLPPQLKLSTPARIKVMAELDISEKRLPQDGRLQVRTNDRQVDVRVSVLPTQHGEKIVMRLLDQGNSSPDLTKIGFEGDQLDLFRKAASQPYGMILVTGPTGSGKTTTLYGILTELNQPDVNISTVEDPIEYSMLGINQVQMKEAIGLNFASALRSLLRQDPDIIMVGEIRDGETAEIGVKAALTGHLVFSTLHTNDASSSISRLLHMGLEAFLITASVTLIQAQRLVRIICPECAKPDPKVTPEELLAAEMPESWLETAQIRRGTGCEKCSGTGFRGRKGVFEVLYMTEALRNLVIKGANADQIKAHALEHGMITLRQSALMKLHRGETTLEEVLNNSRPDGDMKA
jgi:type IV pilus assembly protein PilB